MLLHVPITNLRNLELLEFIRSVIMTCQRSSPDKLNLRPILEEMEKYLADMDKAYGNEKNSPYTQLLIEIDIERDNIITGIRKYVESMTYHIDEAKIEAGKKILSKIDSFGSNIPRLNYVTETTVLINLIRDLENTEELKNAMEVLDITAWVASLKSKNEEFHQKYEEKIKTSESSILPSINELKPLINETYNKLKKHIEATDVLMPSIENTTLMNDLNTILARFGGILKLRKANIENNVESNGNATEEEAGEAAMGI